jgi:hypothetical protein
MHSKPHDLKRDSECECKYYAGGGENTFLEETASGRFILYGHLLGF